MVFSSLSFLFLFLPIFLLLYSLTIQKYKNLVLLTFSLIFYCWGEAALLHIPLLILSIGVNYFCGYFIECRQGNRRKIFLLLGILWNIGMLTLFKYADFLIGLTGDIFKISFPVPDLHILKNLPLPLGISFYTFKAMTYIIDVYKGRVAATESIIKMATYISMFPQITAGPIVRYATMENEISNRSISSSDLGFGSKIFVIGLASKVILANQFAIYADTVFAEDPGNLSAGIAWLGAISYTLQIYFDFAGYSLMAIGLGRIIGFHTPDNFNLPYLSQSVTEFWRRWHITLSFWFRDYLYIPLGGNRKGNLATYRNLFIVFLLCGIWHGANITFLLWGIYHGLFLILERKFRNANIAIQIPRLIRHIYLILVIVVGWVFFRSDNITYALNYLGIMFGVMGANGYYTTSMFSFLPCAALITAGFFCSLFNEKAIIAFEHETSKRRKLFATCSYVIVFSFCLVLIVINTHNPFIYARF